MPWLYLVVAVTSLAASALTLFSGFGLGTLLMPVFAIFFATEVAVALTAVVHFLNNLFKLALVGRYADRAVVVRFGLPALIAAALGAWVLVHLGQAAPLGSYSLAGRVFHIEWLNLVIALLMAGFALIELSPAFAHAAAPAHWLPLGGLLSGFFGGLSGHQGALRAMFLIKLGLSKKAYIGTGVVIACLIDVTRLAVYLELLRAGHLRAHAGPVVVATLAAFLGAWAGARMMHKVTIRQVQFVVAVLLLLLAIALGAGWLDHA